MFRVIMRAILAIFVVCAIAACASFPQNQIAAVKKMPDMSSYQDKPVVYFDVKFYRGKPGKSAVEVPAAKNMVDDVVRRVAEESALFEAFSFDPASKAEADYTIQLHYYNHGNSGAAAISGFITGFTFGIIPGSATDNYTLEAKVLDTTGNVVTELENHDAVRTWVGIWFIPAMGNTPKEAANSVLENMTRDAFKRIINKGQLEYSFKQIEPTEFIAYRGF